MDGNLANSCPEFPFFGAHYPDARCIDGHLWDLDKCDENGNLYGEGVTACPFCNTESFIVDMTDITDEEIKEIESDPSFSKKDITEILDTNMTKADAIKLAEQLKAKYL